MRDESSKSIRVHYDHQETGWAMPLGDNLAVIENIPLTERCNFGDVVRLEPAGADGLPRVGAIVQQRFSAKSVVYYYGLVELQTLSALLKLLGCETEGAQSPRDFTPGILLVAHDRHVRPDLLAAAAGVPQPFGVPTRVALRGGCLVADTGELRLEKSDGSEVARWRQADWVADPDQAARILDTLHRCVSRGVEAAGLPAAGSGCQPCPEDQLLGDPVPRAHRPTTLRFRRWRYLD